MTENSEGFSLLLDAIVQDVQSRDYLYSGIYQDNLIEIGEALARGREKLVDNVKFIVGTTIDSLPFNQQVFIWSECFAKKTEKERLLKELAEYLSNDDGCNLFESKNITETLRIAFTEGVLEKADTAYSDYKHNYWFGDSHE